VILQLNTAYSSYVSENKANGRSWFGV